MGSSQPEVVANTVLWFIHERMKILKTDLSVKSVVDYFESKIIESAKDILYKKLPVECRPNNLRKEQRQGPNKSEGDVRDMIGVMHEMSMVTSFTPPLFATVSSNFSSIKLNNLDALTMWHDIINLKKELELLKQVQTEKNDYVDDLKSELKKSKSFTLSFNSYFSKQCGCVFSAQACCAFFC